MSAFLPIAAVMLLAAVLIVLWPLWRSAREASAGERPWIHSTMLVALVLLPVLAIELYNRLSSWPWDATDEAVATQALADKVRQLERRLATDSGDVEGWMMLGRSYLTLEQPQNAAKAYREAYRLTNGRDAGVAVELAEAIVFSDPDALADEAAELLERALALAPDNPKALWYGGLSAYATARPELALQRWQRLLTMSPPEPLVRALTAQIDEIERELAQSAAGSAAAAAPSAAIDVHVSLAPELDRELPSDGSRRNLPVFVIARDAAAEAGPPVAVARHELAELPLELTLTDADSMLAQRKLSDLEQVRLIARIARGGTPTAQPGDLYGEAIRRRGEQGTVELVIDRVVE